MATELTDTIVNGTLTMHGQLKLSTGYLSIAQGGTGRSGAMAGESLLKVNSNSTAIEGVPLSNGAYDITAYSAVAADNADMANYLLDCDNPSRKIYFSATVQPFATYLAGFRVDGNNRYTVKDVNASTVSVSKTTRVAGYNINVGSFSSAANTISFV